MDWMPICGAPRGPVIEARRVVEGRVIWQGRARWAIWKPMSPEGPLALAPAWVSEDGRSRVPSPTEFRRLPAGEDAAA